MSFLRKNKLYIAYISCIVLLLVIVAFLRNTEENVIYSEKTVSISSSSSPSHTETKELISTLEKPALYKYIRVIDSCGPHYEGVCVNVRSAPNTEAPVVFRARNDMVLKISGTVEKDGRTWHKITFDEWLRYPERVSGPMYIAGDYTTLFEDRGNIELTTISTTTNKRIIVDRSDQMLYAYEGNEIFMEQSVSTGLDVTPTPRGTFTIFKKQPTRYMQGPIPEISEKHYDLPGVPWNLYFTEQGAIIHGAYWHQNFGQQWSNGCVNLPNNKAEELYRWADVGTKVIVKD